MQADWENKKCAVCGEESEQLVILSDFVRGRADFDLRPVGSMAGIGSEIQQCPHCKYCNYEIDYLALSKETVGDDVLKWWREFKPIKEILAKDEDVIAQRYLIMAVISLEEGNIEASCNHFIEASWTSANNASEYRKMALELFGDGDGASCDRLLQMCDIARQEKDFSAAEKFLNAAEKLIVGEDEQAKFIKKIVKYQRKFIAKKDSARHNMEEIK